MKTDVTKKRVPTVECVQCGHRRRKGEFGKWWPTGAWSCAKCYDADFG